MRISSLTFFDSDKCYRTVNTYRSALSSVLPPIERQPVGQHPLIVRLVKGLFNEKPAVPRYACTWNVNVVLKYLKTLHLFALPLISKEIRRAEREYMNMHPPPN